jgi:hypothetical protein
MPMPTRSLFHPRSGADRQRAGAVNWTVLLWALGVPIPLVLIIGLMRRCS